MVLLLIKTLVKLSEKKKSYHCQKMNLKSFKLLNILKELLNKIASSLYKFFTSTSGKNLKYLHVYFIFRVEHLICLRK